MTQFIGAEVRARRRMIAGLAAGAFTFMVIMGLAYHSVGVEGLGQAFHDGLPRTFTAFSGSRSGDLLSPHGWIGFGFNHPMVLVTTLTVSLAIGSGAVAGEVDSGRAELLFTGPVDRTRFLGATLVVWLAAESVVVVAALAGAIAGSLLSDDLRAAGVGALGWAAIQLLPLTAFVAAIAFAASALSRTRERALGAAVGATVLAYLVSVVSGLIASLDWLRWSTPFGYYDPGAAIVHGPRPWPIVALLGASVVLLAIARTALERRDLA